MTETKADVVVPAAPMATTRQQLSAALERCIEQAPVEAQEHLYKTLKAFRDVRGPNLDKIVRVQPLAGLLFDAIDEGLVVQNMSAAIEAEENVAQLVQK